MVNNSLILLGKTISQISKRLNRGNGSTWPGHIALKINPHFIRDILANTQIKIIIVAGTNGKTTTSSLIKTGLEKNGKTVLQNTSGANLLNGIASTLLLNSKQGKLPYDYALFEVDENALPLVLKQVTPDYIVLLNLFRDQLDRYGEINTITTKWHEAIEKLPQKTKLILNADDPQIAYLGIEKSQSLFFGLDTTKQKEKKSPQAADSISCPKCNSPLHFNSVTFSHLGQWSCKDCGLQHPKSKITNFSSYPLSGMYNRYNTHAAVLVLTDLGITEKQIEKGFINFTPAFGRQETITYKETTIQLFLSKNPTSFNQSYQAIKELHATTLLIVLNDRIPDGRDISWIWDTDLSEITTFKQIIISGDRVYDMALRIKYEEYTHFKTFENLNEAIDEGIKAVDKKETLFILPTYSAMLDIRKILTGKKIL